MIPDDPASNAELPASDAGQLAQARLALLADARRQVDIRLPRLDTSV